MELVDRVLAEREHPSNTARGLTWSTRARRLRDGGPARVETSRTINIVVDSKTVYQFIIEYASRVHGPCGPVGHPGPAGPQ